jgi:hypothetical protein
MLDVFDFFGDKGAIPEKIRESQKRRYAPVEAVDEIIALAEEAKAGESPCHDFKFNRRLILWESSLRRHTERR